VHVLIVPKKAVSRLADATDGDAALLGKLLLVARDVAKELELSSGYRVVINCDLTQAKACRIYMCIYLANARWRGRRDKTEKRQRRDIYVKAWGKRPGP